MLFDIHPTYPFALLLWVSTLVVGTPTSFSPSPRSVLTSKQQQYGKLRYRTYSGVCETTPGVRQMSGYIEAGLNMSMWFWFFESRESPETAPFTLWLNGGPGCSSMIGLFQENGPCHVNPDGQTTSLNPFSWNNISNMIYIDQPIDTGFSHGVDMVNSTETAAPLFWTAIQILLKSQEFTKYQNREFIFATESYGGHFGPAFVTYFMEQNTKIRNGQLQGVEINVSALMINNAWIDPLIQDKAYIDFAANAPGYGPVQNESVIAEMSDAYFRPGGCTDQEEACYSAGNTPESSIICRNADEFCDENIFTLTVRGRDVYDLRQADPIGSFPPQYFVTFLQLPEIRARIGAETNFSVCSDASFQSFVQSGDRARTSLPQLAALVNSGLKVLIWAGDADIICNWLGNHAAVLAMEWYGKERLRREPFTDITMNERVVAAVQNVDNFTFARIYTAGHEVPAFQPAASLEIFRQVINMQPLHSV